MELDEILIKLLGDIQPLCDEHYDSERYENLNAYEKVFDWIVNELIECAKWKNDNRYSANRIGERAYDILKMNYEQIEDELRIIEENNNG